MVTCKQVCVCVCDCCVLCICVCMVILIYISPHKCLSKVHKTSVCTFAFRLLPLDLEFLFG